MKVEIEINEAEIEKMVKDQMARNLHSSYETESYVMEKEMGKAIKEIIYKEKDMIVEKCVERASRELVRRGLAKLVKQVELSE